MVAVIIANESRVNITYFSKSEAQQFRTAKCPERASRILILDSKINFTVNNRELSNGHTSGVCP